MSENAIQILKPDTKTVGRGYKWYLLMMILTE